MDLNNTDIRLESFRHSTEVQIRFNDIDILGHVNNTVYLTFYDTAKARYMEAVKGGNINWQKVETVIANIDCAFVNPTYFGEVIKVYTRCLSIHDKSFRLLQVIAGSEGQIKSVCESVMVSFDTATLRPSSVPDDWRHDLSAFEGRDLNVSKA